MDIGQVIEQMSEQVVSEREGSQVLPLGWPDHLQGGRGRCSCLWSLSCP